MNLTKKTARTVAAAAAATAVALVGVGTAVAQSGAPELPASSEDGQTRAAEVRSEKAEAGSDNGLHKGWSKMIDNPGKGKRKGWDQHGQHGGAPATEDAPDAEDGPRGKSGEAPGKSGEKGKSGQAHGKAGQDHGKAGEKGKGAEKGKAGQDHGKAGQPKPEKPDTD